MRAIRRRTLLGAGAVGVAAAVGGVWLRERDPELVVPTGPAGEERVTKERSAARGRDVDFYTAVPDGYGDGRGLPVCLILHGGSKRPGDFAALGLGGFLTDAVRRGAAPFVLAGATGDRLGWKPHRGDDPQRMVHEEVPAWCAARDFDTTRMAAWGWSMGGSGALLLAQTFPSFVRSVAAFSPAVRRGDEVFAGVDRLGSTPVGLWCGRGDNLYDNVRDLESALPAKPAAGDFGDGNHNFNYWSTAIPAAFDFLATTLSSA
jgi:hypothetical protein